ncbi:MAG: 2-phospho-L-lactate transferase [Candidatus Bathyarchaeia archaeon]
MIKRITCLAGGVGAAKFLQGLARIVPQENITIIANTGDDVELYRLHISPDPDIIMYTLAGIVDEDKGWGIKNDTFNCLSMLEKYGLETWFKLGDKDLATHIFRTQLLKNDIPLNEVVQKLCNVLGLKVKILPVSNERIIPQIVTDVGKMHFEEYLVKRGARDKVLNVVFEGAGMLRPAPGVIESIKVAECVIVCPSNPIVSIGPILAVKGIREALMETAAKVIAISPIVGGATIKGPADKLMRGLGLEVSAYSVASLYCSFLDVFILDEVDKLEKKKIESLGVKAITANTIMHSLQDKIELAKLTLGALD